MKKLKQCPFCGSEAYVRNSAGGWYVRCSNKKNEMPRVDKDKLNYPFYPECFLAHTKSYGYSTKEQAIEAWNTRAELTCKMIWRYSDNGGSAYTCTNCGRDVYPFSREFEYCPFCTAKVVD